jgi:arginyl-tRNA synthetase
MTPLMTSLVRLRQVFAIGRLASIVPSTVSLEHVPFGLVLGEDGKKFKTRSGETVKLMDLLSEAVRRAHTDLSTRITAEGRTEDADFVEHVSRTVGIGAVKYADLAMNRNSNYRFEYDKMLALNGNTAPFMLYAYARIRGIQRRAAEKLGAGALDTARLQASEIMLDAPTELALARHLLKLADVVREVESELLPSKLCEYIFELSGKFNQFYESCPVMQAESAQLQRSRLALCGLSASVLKTSLGLLGIDTLERL